ncbi:MAG: hypothetical protein EHM71_13675 [Zetaproteobacteria bacterium]|nr:MAG: hypothetical protein EHM71_13675 [Zetaproteobacteria bacterium]
MEDLDFPLLGPDETRAEDREEALVRLAEERTLRRVTVRLGILAALLVLLTSAGFYLLWAQLETVRQASPSRPVGDPAERDVQRLEKQLGEVQEQVAKAEARLEDLAAETARRLGATERQQGEQAQGVERLTQSIEEVSRAHAGQSAAPVERLRADLAGIEQLAGTIGAPLAKKLDILAGLSLDPQDKDADAHRALAVVILRDLADAELVRTENLEARARTALGRLAEDRRLRDDRFAEVRLRVLRAVAELRRVDIAIARSTDPAAWERRSWIFVLGALGDAAGMRPLAAIAGSGKEPAEIRAAALRALAGYRIAGAGAVEPWLWADEEIAALAPTRGVPPAIPRDRPEVRQALRAANWIATSRRESPALRRSALAVLQRMGDGSVVGDLRLVLFEEWNVLGEEILQALTGIGGGAAADLLRDFALAPVGGTDLRLRAIVGLRTLGGNRPLVALERIAQEVTDAEVAAAAQRALVAVEEGESGSVPRTLGDLRPPGSSR